ncbi:Cytoplasmic protein [Klebsiella quasipneumoniae subsp. similipneumoniae]
MMSLWDALRMNMMISYQELVRTFLNTDLRDYEYEINNAAIITFGNDLIEVIVYQFSFVISIRAEGEKIKHGLLINFGKNIARQVSSLCASAMRVYPNEKHKPSRQLFHCIN